MDAILVLIARLIHELNCFNPRARDGRDVQSDNNDLAARLVSIHAPVMDAIRTA